MNKTTLFAANGNIKLFGNKNWIPVHKNFRHEIVKWCKENKIKAREHRTNIAVRWFDISLWEIKDKNQRMLFQLRWE